VIRSDGRHWSFVKIPVRCGSNVLNMLERLGTHSGELQ